jgi:hypothetical protein
MNTFYFIFKKNERSDTTTLGILGTLVHFRHSFGFTHTKQIISGFALRTKLLI